MNDEHGKLAGACSHGLRGMGDLEILHRLVDEAGG
jgi:hypothetical protein